MRTLLSVFARSALVAATVLAFASVIHAADAAPLKLPIRIKTGITEGYKDEAGVQWLPDQFYVGGDTIARPDLAIAKTKTPSVYRAERYSVDRYSIPIPNGKYTVKLHFAETYEGVTAAGGRVFSFNVEGKDFKDFDPIAKSGAPLTAYVETVQVEVKDGKLDIVFTPKVENPEINAIEILAP